MRNFVVNAAGLAVLATLAAGMAPASTTGNVIYTWTGVCTFGCDAPGSSASATLELLSTYQPGTQALRTDFVSFSFSSSEGSFEVPFDTGGTPVIITGTTIGTLPESAGSAQVTMPFSFSVGLNSFATRDSENAFPDSWQAQFSANGHPLIKGEASSWTLASVPLPAGLAMLLAALGAMGWVGRARLQ